jgi:L-alanine-DL-glutamate epimerase-like enolase superfamily enzyme
MDLAVRIERWALERPFTISRGTKTEAVVVTVELKHGGRSGRGEAVPYARYGETPEGVASAIEAMRPALQNGLDRAMLQTAMPPGAARNALDCAYWDFEAKQNGCRAYQLAALPTPKPLVTAYTVSLDHPDAMADAAARAVKMPLLKVKLGGGPQDVERIAAARRLRASRGQPDRAAPAGGARSRAQEDRAADPDLRRRECPRSHLAGGAERQVRRNQYQARQNGWIN